MTNTNKLYYLAHANSGLAKTARIPRLQMQHTEYRCPKPCLTKPRL